MTYWHPTSALVGLPGMPAKSTRAITYRGPLRGWISRRSRRRGHEWLESSLPAETQAALAELRRARPVQSHYSGRLPNERYAAIATARLEVLDTLDRWLNAERPARLGDGLRAFAERYTAGAIPVSPETRTAIPRCSRVTLYDWRRARREGGWSGLMPRYAASATNTARIDADPDLSSMLAAFILEHHPRDRAPMARRWLVARCGEDRVPCVASVKRWMARWRKANASLLMAETDPDGWRSRYMPAFGEADAGVVALNQRWELDSTPADVLCTDGRYTLIGAIDVYSRRAKVHVAPTSTADAVARGLLRRAILDWGVPATVATDNGKDYVSRHVRGVLRDLGIKHAVMPPYSPERKPFIERFFGTLTRGLLAYLPGYAGASVPERQRLRERRSFAARRGEDAAETYRVELTAAELQARIDTWIETIYERDPHSGLEARSPFEAAAAGQPVNRIADERALDLLLAPPPSGGKYRTVNNDGIRVERGTYFAAELGPWVGYRVELRVDPIDWGLVYVFAGDVVPPHLDIAPGKFIACAEDPRRRGIDRAEVAARAKAFAKAAAREGRAHGRKLRRAWSPDIAMDDVLHREAERSGQVLLFPGRESAHASPALEEAAAAHRSDVHQAEQLEALADIARIVEPRFRKEGIS